MLKIYGSGIYVDGAFNGEDVVARVMYIDDAQTDGAAASLFLAISDEHLLVGTVNNDQFQRVKIAAFDFEMIDRIKACLDNDQTRKTAWSIDSIGSNESKWKPLVSVSHFVIKDEVEIRYTPSTEEGCYTTYISIERFESVLADIVSTKRNNDLDASASLENAKSRFISSLASLDISDKVLSGKLTEMANNIKDVFADAKKSESEVGTLATVSDCNIVRYDPDTQSFYRTISECILEKPLDSKTDFTNMRVLIVNGDVIFRLDNGSCGNRATSTGFKPSIVYFFKRINAGELYETLAYPICFANSADDHPTAWISAVYRLEEDCIVLSYKAASESQDYSVRLTCVEFTKFCVALIAATNQPTNNLRGLSNE